MFMLRHAINESDVIFGKFDIVEDYILINHILLLAKYYIVKVVFNSIKTVKKSSTPRE